MNNPLLKNFQPVKVAEGRHSITGMLAVAAVMGMIVTRKAGSLTEVELADGKAGWMLREDVVTAADRKNRIDQEIIRPNKLGFELPYVIGGQVTAEDYAEVWVEGDALDESMDASVTADTQVTAIAGKFGVLTNNETQESMGIVKENIAAYNTASPARRFLIEIRRSTKNIPAA